MTFYLGTHMCEWLGRVDVPLFVSRRRLAVRRAGRARAPWALDSGGFSELSLYGEWRTEAEQYADEAQEWQGDIGRLAFAAPQDWMCEPFIVGKTGLTVQEHQARTIESVQRLRELAPGVPWVPVVQGWEVGEYLAHVESYRRAGLDLALEPMVAVGTVCRRQGMDVAGEILRELRGAGVQRLHAFGFKWQGLGRFAEWLESADSMSWSSRARWDAPLPGCRHATCANCQRYALLWRARLLESLGGRQLSLETGWA